MEGKHEGGRRQTGRKEGRQAGMRTKEGEAEREVRVLGEGGRERESGLRNRESEREATTKHLGALRKVSIIMRNCV